MIDVIIAGYGPVALATAAILAQNGMKVALFKEAHAKRRDACGNVASRLLALASSSVKFLQKHGLALNITEVGQPIKKIHVKQYRKEDILEFCPSEIASDNFGYMVDEKDLWSALHNDVLKLANIQHFDSHIESIDNTKELIVIRTSENLVVEAALLMIADGKNSLNRKRLNFEVLYQQYQQVALVCDIEHTEEHRGIAKELFMPSGPFATLPKIGGFSSSIVWTEAESNRPFLENLRIDELESLIQARCGGGLGKIKCLNKPSIWSLSLMRAKKAVSKNTLLIGDALHSIHPLAGQGLNLGLRDVSEITSLLQQVRGMGASISSAKMLLQYQLNRESDIITMSTAVGFINELYSNNSPFLSFLGAKAINFLQYCHPMRRMFMQYAVGNHTKFM